MHHVVGGDPVGGDEQQALTEVVDVSDLSRREEREVGDGGNHGPDASDPRRCQPLVRSAPESGALGPTTKLIVGR